MNNSNGKLVLLARKAFSLALSFGITIVTLEVALGLAFWIKDRQSGAIHLSTAVDHPYTYFTFAPDRARFTNEDGLYTKASRTKAQGKFRIVLVGGSLARSGQGRIPYEHAIASELERELNSRLTTGEIEVVNAGMSAYVAEQEFILVQLVLQYYQPDMIITLDGYNDLLSFDANRPYEATYSPIQYRQLKVVEQGREQRSWLYRIKACFRNIFRAKNYFVSVIWKDEKRDYAKISDSQINQAASEYMNILRDMKDFASAKRIAFHSFLQPVRWYVPNDPVHVRLQGVPQLGSLYARYDEAFKQTSWASSLTDVFGSRSDLYIDDVHVIAEGNRILASAMADSLEKRLSKDPSSGKISISLFP